MVDGALQAGDQLVALDAHEEFALVQDAQPRVLVGEVDDEINQLAFRFVQGRVLIGERLDREVAIIDEFDGRRTRGYRLGFHSPSPSCPKEHARPSVGSGRPRRQLSN